MLPNHLRLAATNGGVIAAITRESDRSRRLCLRRDRLKDEHACRAGVTDSRHVPTGDNEEGNET